MSNVASQMLPEAFNGIEFWRVRRQTDQFDLILMSRQESKNGPGKMNPIVIDDYIDLARRQRGGGFKELRKHRTKQSVVLMIAGGPEQLPADPMDQSSPRAFLIFTRGLDDTLVASLTPTAGDGGQEGQVNFILRIQVNLSGLGLLLQGFNPGNLAFIVGIRTLDREHWTQLLILMLMQVIAHTALIQGNPGFGLQMLGQQRSRPIRERTPHRSGIDLDEFKQPLQVLRGDPGRTPSRSFRQQGIQTMLIELMDPTSDRILAIKGHLSNVRYAHRLGRQQQHLASGLDQRIRRSMIELLQHFSLVWPEFSHIDFTWSGYDCTFLLLAVLFVSLPRFPQGFRRFI